MSNEAIQLLWGLLGATMLVVVLLVSVWAMRGRPTPCPSVVNIRIGPGKGLPAGTYVIDMIHQTMSFTAAPTSLPEGP